MASGNENTEVSADSGGHGIATKELDSLALLFDDPEGQVVGLTKVSYKAFLLLSLLILIPIVFNIIGVSSILGFVIALGVVIWQWRDISHGFRLVFNTPPLHPSPAGESHPGDQLQLNQWKALNDYTALFASVMRERGSPGLCPPESQQPHFSGVQDTSPCWSAGVHLRHQVRIGPDGSWEYVSRYEVKWGSGSNFDENNYWRISSGQFSPEPSSSQLGAPGIAYITDKLHSTLDRVEQALTELVQQSLAMHAPGVVIDRPR